jgi:hypothetical protein
VEVGEIKKNKYSCTDIKEDRKKKIEKLEQIEFDN